MTLHVISPAEGLGNSSRALNIVMLSEGFLASRQNVFLAHVRQFDRVLRATSPFHSFPTLITVSALFVPSTVSIAHITDDMRCDWRVPNASGQLPPDNAPSPFATPFGALYCRARDTTPARKLIDRFLHGDSAKVRAAIAAEPVLSKLRVTPLVLIDNTQASGGSAHDGIGWFSMNSEFDAVLKRRIEWWHVAIHELGHAAFDLADEYDYDGPARFSSTEPTEPNVTTRSSRDALRIFWSATPSKFSLFRWSELMDPATPAPTSMPNVTCTPLATENAQSAKPGVGANVVGLFEGADHSPCSIFRPRLDCRMRHAHEAFCPVCEWAIRNKLARTQDPLQVARTATVPGAWTVLGFYHEERSRVLRGSDLGRLVFYAGGTGQYEIQSAMRLRDPKPPALNAPGVTIDALWTSLSMCEIGGLPHFLAHSLPLGRLAIYEVIDDAGRPLLVKRFDSGNQAVPWTHVTTFVGGGVPHMIGYHSSTGRIEISRITSNSVVPLPVSSTALDPRNLWLPGYTIITTFTVDSKPHVLKHNAINGVVHVQSLDPPGRGPNTFLSHAGHWSPGATAAIACEIRGRAFVLRTSLTNYEAIDWVWPGGAGVDVQLRHQSLDVTLSMAEIRGKTEDGFSPFGVHQIAALDVIGGRVRMMSVG